MDLGVYDLSDGGRDAIVAFWHGWDRRGHHERRAVVGWNYENVSSYLNRLFGLLNATWASQSLNRQLGRLQEPGKAILVSVGRHWLGLMRPALLGPHEAIVQAQPPFLIAFELAGDKVELPVLAADRADAVKLVRRLDEDLEAQKQGWRPYVCEREKGAFEQVALQVINRQVVTYRTDLERLMLYVERGGSLTVVPPDGGPSPSIRRTRPPANLST